MLRKVLDSGYSQKDVGGGAMKKIVRFLKRNCLRIPAAMLVVAMLVTISHFCDEKPGQPENGEKVPVMTVYADEEESEYEYVPSVQEMIMMACEEYGIDHEIAMAIVKLETGHFTSEAFLKGNNVGGLSDKEVPRTYSTIEEGVNEFVENLARNYFAKGLTTPEEIGEKYCPINAEAWADTVKKLMEEA